MEIVGCPSVGLLAPLPPARPRGTGIPDIASGYDERAPLEVDGAFCAPRTEDVDPRGTVQRAPEFTGGRFVLWSGPIR
jgi:hypothetical protein